MNTPRPLPQHDLPPASVATLGCLFLPACASKLILAGLVVFLGLQFLEIIYAVVRGEPVQWGHFEAPLWPVVSAFVSHSLRSGNRRPWVFWLTVVCLAGWVHLADRIAMKVNYPGASEADALRVGAWLATAPAVFMLLWFSLSHRNHAYFGLTGR